jgi:hypothetical protein
MILARKDLVGLEQNISITYFSSFRPMLRRLSKYDLDRSNGGVSFGEMDAGLFAGMNSKGQDPNFEWMF